MNNARPGEHQNHSRNDKSQKYNRRRYVRQLAAYEAASMVDAEDDVEGAARGLEIAGRAVERSQNGDDQSGSGCALALQGGAHSRVERRQSGRRDDPAQVMNDRV